MSPLEVLGCEHPNKNKWVKKENKKWTGVKLLLLNIREYILQQETHKEWMIQLSSLNHQFFFFVLACAKSSQYLVVLLFFIFPLWGVFLIANNSNLFLDLNESNLFRINPELSTNQLLAKGNSNIIPLFQLILISRAGLLIFQTQHTHDNLC